jgi:hypothetical protein
MPHTPSSAPRAVLGIPTEALGYRAGQVIAGKYELLRLLGSGGMGAVWAVRNLIIDAEFALKMVRNDGGEASAAERMLREARSAARIEHPAIVRVFDFGMTERGDPFIVMDLLEGVTVRDILLSEGPMSAVRAAKLLLPIAEALFVAHSRDVIHRDVKTENIMIVPDGHGRVQPTLVDFGIAKQLRTEEERLTMSGTVIGSPEYMSPEQARGLDDVDRTTDVWALCVVFFEMITGSTPFHREDGAPSVLRAITDEPAVPLAAHGINEPALQAILDRGLSKYRDARFDDMRAFGTSVARWLLAKGIEEDASAQSIRAVWFDSHGSAPPVAIDAGRRERLPRLEPSDGYVRSPRKSAWWMAVAVSVLAVGVALGVGLVARGVLRRPEVAGVVEPTKELSPTETPARSESVPAAPLVTPVPQPSAESDSAKNAARSSPPAPPVPSTEPSAAREPELAPRVPLKKRVETPRPFEPEPPRYAAPVPAPPGVDVRDLPSLFVAPSAEPLPKASAVPSAPPAPAAPSATSVPSPPSAVDAGGTPRPPAPPEERREQPKPSDLRNPYPSDGLH